MSGRLVLESKGILCGIYADKRIIDAIRRDKFTYHCIPDAAIADGGEPDITVSQKKGLDGLVDINYPACEFSGELSSRDVVTIGEYLLERRRQEVNGQYGLSSATACYDGRAVTFFGGATNLGKTSSMLELVKTRGYSFVSDEKTLVDLERRVIAGGSRTVPARKNVIKDKVGVKSNGDFASLKTERAEQEAALFMYPHIDHGLQKPIVYQFRPLDFYWLLVRELSSEIRGSVRLVNNFSCQLPSIDTDLLSQLRLQRTRMFTDEVPCFYFQGSVEQIAGFSDGIVRGKYAKRKCR
ncbi:MAG: hypothetical protein KJ955_08390 [Nanoarchaeota archaeon]|nr:hypothetical protein [Nanoarchaeota archaeon]